MKLGLRQFFSFENRSLEEKIFIQTVTVCLAAMVVFTANAAIHHQTSLLIFDLFSSIVLLVFFYLAKYKNKYKQLILPALITMLVMIDTSWFMSGGYTGPNTFFLIIVLIIGLIISSKKQRYIYTVLVIFNAIALFIMEYQDPSLATEIPFEIDIVGQGTIYVICIIVIAVIVINLKYSYDKDRERVHKMNLQLSEKKAEIELKNKALESHTENLRSEVKLQTQKLADLNADLQEQNTSLEQFTYILSHNIRSPISQLKGLFDLLPNDLSKDKTVVETLERMKNSTYQLGDVIQDLSRIIDIGKNRSERFETVSIIKQLMLAMTTLDDQIRSSKAEIDISEVEHVDIKGISAYVLSIFYNLIHNAIKYAAKERRPKVVITVKQISEHVVITISDNGIGIDMSHAKGRIFQLYQRFNSEREGKGFGLFLIKTQLKTMNGDIEVSSKVGEGTNFTITLPALN
jgi:signal transduction histidine kinase